MEERRFSAAYSFQNRRELQPPQSLFCICRELTLSLYDVTPVSEPRTACFPADRTYFPVPFQWLLVSVSRVLVPRHFFYSSEVITIGCSIFVI